MSRCFLTGQRCLYESEVIESAVKAHLDPSDIKLFAALPFDPTTETAYQWSLKPYLVKGYGINEASISRPNGTDVVQHIVCDKICLRIQCSDLVLGDVTHPDPRTFFELGLATGLDRPIILLRDLTRT